MKNILLIFITTLFVWHGQAQIDRSKMPVPGPSPEIQLKNAQSFTISNGLKVLVVENNKLPRVSIQLEIDNPPILEGNKAGVSSLLSGLLGNGSKSIPKDEFNEEIDFLGARINFGSQSAFATSLSKYFPRILELMADAVINPNFSKEEFEKEKAKLLTALKTQEKDVPAIARRVQRALAYGTDHPYGEFVTEETLHTVTVEDVEKFYAENYVPANAYLIVVGDIKFEQVKKLVNKHFSPWKKASPPAVTFEKPVNVPNTQINFVDMPNAVQSEIVVQNLVNLKMSDPDYFAALMANQILGGGGEARLFLNLREDKGYTYGSYSRLGDDKYVPSRFEATASVRNMVTDSAVVELLKEIDNIRKKPVSAEELKNTKAKYVGRFVLALEKPETIARYALKMETEGLPKDFYKTYLERINALTVEDVQKAAQKYFSTDNARIIVVGKGSDVLKNLENVTFNGKVIPVFYFDKYSKNTDKPDYEAAVPEGMSAREVLNSYFEAIGGKDKLEDISSTVIKAEASMNGATLGLTVKTTTENQSLIEVSFGGMVAQKIVFDGEKGYMSAQGQKIEYTPEQIADAKIQSYPFAELKAKNMILDGVQPYEGGKAYAVKFGEKKTVFYDTETKLKVKEVTVQEQGGQKIPVTTMYSDYKEVKGVKFPFTITQSLGPQKVDFEVKDIVINEGISNEDFK